MKSRQHRLPSLAAGAVLILGGLTACGGATSSPGTQGDPSASAACVAASSYDNPAGTFTFAFTTETRSFDPNGIGAANDLLYLFPVYDRLLLEDAKGNLEPGLAESWKVAKDGSSISLTLRPDIKFHDGTPIDAKAVVANLDRSRKTEGGFNQGTLSTVTSIKALNDAEVQIAVDSGAAGVLSALPGAAGMMVSPAAFGMDHIEMAKKGGSGAFELVDFKSGAESTYTRVDGEYWDKDAYGFSDLVIKWIVDPNARLNAVLTGDVDATMGTDSIISTAQQQGLKTCSDATISAIALSLNTSRDELDNPLVRQAMNYAIDREGISEVVFGGMCAPNSQRFPAWFRGANPDIAADHFEYAPDKAKELMEESGAEGFELDILTPADVNTYPKLAEVLKEQYAEIGISVNILPREISSIFDEFRVQKNADSHLSPITTTEPISYLESFYLKGGLNNPGGYEAEGMSELFDQLRETTTFEDQAPIFAEVATLATEEAYPQVVICNQISSYISNDRVGGLELFYNNVRDFRTVTLND